LLPFFKSNAQVNSKFNLQIDYGLNGNFFVRSYDEIGGPVNKTYLYKKNFLGSIAGAEISYRLKKKSAISFAYRRSVNSGKKNYEGSISNTDIHIRDFKLRHINKIFQLGMDVIWEILVSSKLTWVLYLFTMQSKLSTLKIGHVIWQLPKIIIKIPIL